MDIEELDKLKRQYGILTDDELINIVTNERESFRSEAIAVAENELQHRGVAFGDDQVYVSSYPDCSDDDLLAMISGEQPVHVDGKAAIAYELTRRGVAFETTDLSFAFEAAPEPKPKLAKDPLLKYHTFWRRYWADVFDAFIIILPLWVLWWVFLLPQNPYYYLMWNFAAFVLQSAYRVWFHTRNRGQTIGKAMTRICVLDVTETRPPTLRESFMRDSIYIVINSVLFISFTIFVLSNRQAIAVQTISELFSFIDFVWLILRIGSMMFDAKRRGIHDRMSNTVVVKTKYMDKAR